MNVIDRAIEWMAPEHALRRMDARNRLQMIRRIKNSGYDESAASRKKNYGRGWNPANKSPQEDIDKNLPTLRARSRSLVTSAPLATLTLTGLIYPKKKPSAGRRTHSESSMYGQNRSTRIFEN